MTEAVDTPTAEPAMTAPAAITVRRKTAFAGYTAAQLLIAAALVLALVWAMWVTKLVMAEMPQHIVKADLSRIVGEYVQAQARSATPPDQVQAQMRTFMASLDTELQRRGAAGQVVLVGEAVLSKSVPDITADVARAVYASGVKAPMPATPAQMGSMMQGQVPAAPAIAPVEMAQVAPVPAAPNPFAAVPAPATAQDVAPVDPSVAGAMVSSFGGPGGQ
ncbi:TrbI F-type domain-containing protein [Sphingomonas sp. PP-CE-1G-424]|uniref:TrbI F-type domain-containing protein n=1 Tax=Sphingomonas sp. PP-CE-1G-424 TaxID=2135658 RepID=UPI0010561E19|nr:TrbI F-type domain-containing protein [Sphingomonas sp. PP-CE-1G-424]TCP66181.1 type F conjugative transfer system protein TrbI [Sphingomonas sp. PP-CE-1G-424]